MNTQEIWKKPLQPAAEICGKRRFTKGEGCHKSNFTKITTPSFEENHETRKKRKFFGEIRAG